MYENVEDLLHLLSEALKVSNPDLLNSMYEGVDSNYVRDKINGIDVELPSEIYHLYTWHNGTKTEGEFTLGTKWHFSWWNIHFNRSVR